MSSEQRHNNLGIDSELRNSDPAEYDRQLKAKMKELNELFGKDETPSRSEDPKAKGD